MHKALLLSFTFIASFSLHASFIPNHIQLNIARIYSENSYASTMDFPEDKYSEYKTDYITVSDPLEFINRPIFAINDVLIEGVFSPLSDIYTTVVPPMFRDGISNFFDNAAFPVRLVNSVLQGRTEKVVKETKKFAINTTVGVLGIMKPSDKYPALRHSGEDLGQTLGHWGIANGPYVVLPLIGPVTLRDFVGRIGDSFLKPLNYIEDDEVVWTLNIVETINDIPPIIQQYEAIRNNAIDPYIAVKDAYTQRRHKLVLE